MQRAGAPRTGFRLKKEDCAMLGILKTHPELRPYESDLKLRMDLYRAKKRQLLPRGKI